MSDLRNAACELADRGWAIHPLVPRAKRPLTKNGKDDATTDLATVLGWWQRWPKANIGVHCNPSGLVVIDIDPRNGGDDSIHELEKLLGTLPTGPSAETGGGGTHYLFKHPGVPLVGKLADGVDVKDHGYILAAPSVHPSGGRYEWDLHPDEIELPELPERWLEAMVTTARTGPTELNVNHADELRRIPAATYVERLAGRAVNRAGFAQCPFHGGGEERTPSLKATGTLWACHACQPILGKRVLGGNIFDFTGLLWGYPIPLRGADYTEVRARLEHG